MHTAFRVSDGMHIPPPSAEPLLRQAMELEASFLAEMLGHGGLNASSGSFSGGYGEEQFSSFLSLEQARAIVTSGGIGLAEEIFRALNGPSDDA